MYKVFIVMKFSLPSFSFVACAFDVQVIIANQSHELLPYVFF